MEWQANATLAQIFRDLVSRFVYRKKNDTSSRSLLSEGYVLPKRKRSAANLPTGMLAPLLWEIERKLKLRKCLLTVASLIVAVPAIILLISVFIVLKIYRTCKKFWVLHKTNYLWDVLDISTETIMDSACENNNTLTFVASLEGVVELSVVRKEIEQYINKQQQKPSSNEKLKRILRKMYGFYAWKRHHKFDISNHVTLGLQHHQGYSLCQKNIQEYISDVCSESLSSDYPPWQIVVTYGWGENEQPISWVIFRAHKLLVQELSLHDICSSLPNPWAATTETRPLNILSAPSVLLKLKDACLISLVLFVANALHFAIYRMAKAVAFILHPRTLLVRPALLVRRVIINLLKMPSVLRCVLNMRHNFPSAKSTFALVLVHVSASLVVSAILTYHLPNLLLLLLQTALGYIGVERHLAVLFQEALVEIFWSISALVSIPRLLVAELYENQSSAARRIWRVKRETFWERSIVAWSDDIPLAAAKEMRSVPGMCIPSVVLAALGLAIRDLVKSSGTAPSTRIRCTFPVYIPNRSQVYGLLPFALPTAAPNGHTALRQSFESMEKLRRYPERYLASIWLRKYLPHFVPVCVFKWITNNLTATHPILLTYLIGPNSTSYLWGKPVKSCFLWRPPQQNAVMSVCVTSYCDRISIGVMANGWSVPLGGSLPRLFSLHFAEILHEHGILMQVLVERRKSRSRSRGNSFYKDADVANEGSETPNRRSCLPSILRRMKSSPGMQSIMRANKCCN